MPKIRNVSRGSIAACVTVTVAHGPLANLMAATAVSSTSRSKIDVGREANGLAHRTEERQQQLEAVAAEVEHRTAAGLRPFDEPVALVVGLRVEAFEGVNLGEDRSADFAAAQNLAHAGDDGIEMAIVGNAEPHVIGRGGGDHAIAVGDVERHRLLAEHVLPRLGGRDRLRGVQVHRRGEIHGVDRRVADEIFPARVPAVGTERLSQTPQPGPHARGSPPSACCPAHPAAPPPRASGRCHRRL